MPSMTTDAPSLSGLNARETGWLRYIRDSVVPHLLGSDEQRAHTAAVVSWWALKEGILDLPNPIAHSLCHEGSGGDRTIGPLEVCNGAIWQVGISGVQAYAPSDARLESVTRAVRPGESGAAILRSAAEAAGLDASAVEAVATSSGALRRSWLLRDPAIAFEVQSPYVESGCLSGKTPSWCFGSWPTARAFASSIGRAHEAVGALESYYRGAPSASSSGTRTALALALALGAGATYLALYTEPGRAAWSQTRRALAF